MRLIKPQKKRQRLGRNRRRSARLARKLLSAEQRALRFKMLLQERQARLRHPPMNASRVPLIVPEVLSLRENYAATVRLINDIRDFALDNYIPVDLYFHEVRLVEPAALMALTAEIHRCRNLRRVGGKPLVGGSYPADPDVYEQLQRTGFFRLLEIRDPRPLSDDLKKQSKVLLPFITDAEVTAERSADFLDKLAELVEEVVTIDVRSLRYLQGAIVEAMKNAGEHAYKRRPQHQMLGRRWWLSGAFDRETKEVSIILFDQGIGIPATLEPDLRARAESVARLEGLSPSDSLMIEIATRTGNTSTHQAGRGQGFKTMRKFVDSCEDGDLLVYSNTGHYMYARSGTARSDAPFSLGGTLIQWRFRHSTPLSVA